MPPAYEGPSTEELELTSRPAIPLDTDDLEARRAEQLEAALRSVLPLAAAHAEDLCELAARAGPGSPEVGAATRADLAVDGAAVLVGVKPEDLVGDRRPPLRALLRERDDLVRTLADVLPYAESRAEDLEEIAEDAETEAAALHPREDGAHARAREARGHADEAWTAVDEAQGALGKAALPGQFTASEVEVVAPGAPVQVCSESVSVVDRKYQEMVADGRLSEERLREAFDRRFPPRRSLLERLAESINRLIAARQSGPWEAGTPAHAEWVAAEVEGRALVAAAGVCAAQTAKDAGEHDHLCPCERFAVEVVQGAEVAGA